MNRPTGLLALMTLAAAGWIVACSEGGTGTTAPSFQPGGGGATEKCTDQDITDQFGTPSPEDATAPFTLTSPTGTVITAVCVKAGNEVFILTPQNTTDGCYTAVFSNSGRTVTVTRTGAEGPTCQDISHIRIFTGPGPSPTPTPTPTPSPTS